MLITHLGSNMVTFLYRCPSTARNAQGWFADELAEREDEAYQAITCPACHQTHFVNRTTLKVLRANSDGQDPT
jgi:hypothetical protein